MLGSAGFGSTGFGSSFFAVVLAGDCAVEFAAVVVVWQPDIRAARTKTIARMIKVGIMNILFLAVVASNYLKR
jgi:hypothetical protein